MPGVVPGIHVFLWCTDKSKTWMAGSSPAMTDNCVASRPRQIEDALGHDAEHHLAGAALDRVGLGAQPGARAGAASGALALPFQRVDPPGRHQDFVTPLLHFAAVIFH